MAAGSSRHIEPLLPSGEARQAIVSWAELALPQPTLIIVAVGQTSETDAAQAVAWSPKERLIGQASETDSAQVVTAPFRILVGQVTEIQDHPVFGEDAYGGGPYGGGPFSGYGAIQSEKTKTLGQAAETDSSTALVFAATKRAVVSWAEISLPVGVTADAVAQATEIELAQAVTRIKSHVLGMAFEQGALYPSSITYPAAEIFPSGAPNAQPINSTISALVGQAVETDLAQQFAVNPDVGQAFEDELAQAITEVKSVTLGQALETDTAQTFGGGNLREAIVSWAEVSLPAGAPITLLGQAQETELVQSITPVQGGVNRIAAAGFIFMWGDPEAAGAQVVVGQPSETDLSQAITVSKTFTLGQATETDAAQAVTTFNAFPVGQALETELAQAITVVGGGDTIPVGQVLGTDLAQPIIWKQIRLVGLVLESDEAIELDVLGGFDLDDLDCDDLTLIPEPDFSALYPSAITFPSSMTYPSEGSDDLDSNLTPDAQDSLVLVPA